MISMPRSTALHMSYTVRHATLAAVRASISMPVLPVTPQVVVTWMPARPSSRSPASTGAAMVTTHAAVLAGDMEEPDDDVEAAHMEIAARVLAEAGYERYEVASYARPGFECRHNIAYWTGVPYLGLGRSAATMTQNAERRMRVQDGRVTDDMDARGMAAEDLMLGMRMTCGVPDELVEAAAVLLPDAPAVLAELEGEGLVAHADGRWRPTDRGWLCGNELYGRLFDLA